MEKLEDGCLNPVIQESTPEHVTIRIDCPERGKDCFITITLKDWEFQLVTDDEDDDENESDDELEPTQDSED